MTDAATGQRSHFQALKVPFDLKGIAAGALAYLALALGGEWLAGARFALDGGSSFNLSWSRGEPRWALPLLSFLVCAVFGVASCRIAAMRIARDEGTGLREALGFALANLGSTLKAAGFLLLALLFFTAANALAGLVGGIPGVGAFFLPVLYPLVLVSTLILFLLSFGATLGFPLVLASLAVERNGALDAVSRAFSYVYSRPIMFFFSMASVGFIAILLLACTLTMEGLAFSTFSAGFPEEESWEALARGLRRVSRAVLLLELPEMGGIEGPAWFGSMVAWACTMVFHLLLMGWVVYYMFGGATAAYFALRRDVDGTEDEEIWVAGEKEEGFGEAEGPEAAPGPEPDPGPDTAG